MAWLLREKALDKLNPLAVGLKLQLAFNCGNKKNVVVEEDPEIIEEIVVIEEEIVEIEEPAEEPEIVEISEPEPQEEILPELIIDNYIVNTAKLTPEQCKRIDEEIIPILLQRNELKVIAEGHTCDLGNEAINIRLGQQRADAVKAYIVSKGIDESRITTASYADTKPRVPNTSEANRKINRRVRIQVVK